MSATFLCDGCLATGTPQYDNIGDAFMPRGWRVQHCLYATRHACGQECQEAIQARTSRKSVAANLPWSEPYPSVNEIIAPPRGLQTVCTTSPGPGTIRAHVRSTTAKNSGIVRGSVTVRSSTQNRRADQAAPRPEDR